MKSFNYSTATTNDNTEGGFSLPFECYYGVMTTVNFNVTVTSYKEIDTSSVFDCNSSTINLPALEISLS
jgi:hypothetical protein